MGGAALIAAVKYVCVWEERGGGGSVCGCECVCVIVCDCVGEEGSVWWGSRDCCCKVCVIRGRGRGGVCVWMCVCVTVGVWV